VTNFYDGLTIYLPKRVQIFI